MAPASSSHRGLRLRPSCEIFEAPDGDVYLLGVDGDVVLDQPDAATRLVLQALRRGVGSIAELVQILSAEGHEVEESELENGLSELGDAGVLTTMGCNPTAATLSAQERLRYDRQLAYFAEVRAGEELVMQKRLSSATVVILGVGGLGSWTAAALACAGIGGLVLVDDDTIELHNLNRQFLYTPADVGTSKVDVARRALRRFNPALRIDIVRQRITSAADLDGVIGGTNFVVETADWPPYEIGRWVNAVCLDAGLPHVSAGQLPPKIRIGPTFVPGRTACATCRETQARNEFEHYDLLLAQRQRQPQTAITLGPPSATIGSVLAMDIVHYLIDACDPATLGASLTIDLRTWQLTRTEVVRDPHCPACGIGAAHAA